MAIIKKTLSAENLDKFAVLVNDIDVNSKYFKVTELPDTFTGGKNAFLIQGSEYLVADTLIKIEIKDAQGNIIYHEPGEGIISASVGSESIVTEYYEGVSKVVAVYIYPNRTLDTSGNYSDGTAYGPATITILGELSTYDNNGTNVNVPTNWEGKYNVKWQKTVNVNPALANTTKVRFYKRPTATIFETLSPIYTFDTTGSKVASNVTQSFANIKVSQLDTFAGDVKRIKVYRTSQGDISDYDLIQDILVESKELLSTTALSGSVVGTAGFFTSEVVKKLWNTGSLNTLLTSSRVDNGLRLNGSGKFRYTSSLNLSDVSVYEFGIDAFYSASTSGDLQIYLSGSNNGELLVGTLNGISPTKNLKDTIIQFSLPKAEPTASLYLSQSQGEWHIGNLTLQLTQDTAFSPSEISFVTSMPTVIGNETYNFKFEFYDVNNNYVPVAVTQSAQFTGGNNNIGGTLTFISSSASQSLADLNRVSSSISGTIVVTSGSISGSITSVSSSVSGTITTLSGSVSGTISLLSSSVSSSNTFILSSSLSKVQQLANGQYSGSFIGDTVIYSPTIGGQQGYISDLFKVGTSPSIYLDARQNPRKIFIGGVTDSGSYNNSNTSVYMDSTGKFSLGNKLSWNGVDTLSITGNLNVGSSVPNSVVSGLKALALKDTVSATEIDNGAITEVKIGAGAVSNAKIATDAITEAKIATNAVTSGKITANAIIAEKIATDAIVADKIAAGAITAVKINTGAITADKIVTGAITADKILAGAITAGKIDTNAVTAGTIAAGAVTAGKISVADLVALNADIGGWKIDSNSIFKSNGIHTIRLSSVDSAYYITRNSTNQVKVKISPDTTIPAITVASFDFVNFTYASATRLTVTGDSSQSETRTLTATSGRGDTDAGTGYTGTGIIWLQYPTEEIWVDADGVNGLSLLQFLATIQVSGGTINDDDSVNAKYQLTLVAEKYASYTHAANRTNLIQTYRSTIVENNLVKPAGNTFSYADYSYGIFGGGFQVDSNQNWFYVYLEQYVQCSTSNGVPVEDSPLVYMNDFGATVKVQFGRVDNGFSQLAPAGLQVYTGVRNYMNASVSAVSGENFFEVKGKSQFLSGLSVNGTFSASNKQFQITHPLNKNKWLYHTSIEGPQADLIYRGKLNLINGEGNSNIDISSRLTNGTFNALTKNPQLFLQNNDSFDRIKGKIENGNVYVVSENENSSASVDWTVIAERCDTEILTGGTYGGDGKYKTEKWKREFRDTLMITGSV
jgi:hypothetical protein